MKWIYRVRESPVGRQFHWFGIAGSVLLLVCVLVTMSVYVGRAGERYSPLNHFISELGEVGVSRLAPVFNAGLVAAGVLYVPFVLGLGAAVGGWWAAAGTAAGIVSAVSVACVGVFPMNNLPPHITAALTFFRSGLVTVLLFGIAIQRQRPDRPADRPARQHRRGGDGALLRRVPRLDAGQSGQKLRLPAGSARLTPCRVAERDPRVVHPRDDDRLVLRGGGVPPLRGAAAHLSVLSRKFPSLK